MKALNLINIERKILFLAIVLPVCVIADEPERLVVFGDSLSDPGNFFLATGQSVTAPFAPIPDAPYGSLDDDDDSDSKGGFRFSNGPTWAEQLAGELDTRGSGKPALKRPGKFTNYAFGRARARPNAITFPMFDLKHQRDLFLADFGAAPPDAVYVVWIGTNDVRDGLGALLQFDPTGALTEQIFTEALTAIGEHIFVLWQHGARNFLVLNVPDLSITPGVSGLPTEPVNIPAIAQALTFSFNSNLADTLDGLETMLGVQIARLDTFTLLNTVVAAPQVFGFTNVAEPCLTFFVAEDFLCDKPRRYLFLDAAHPTARGHRVVAGAAEILLEDEDLDDDDDSDSDSD